MKRKIFLAMLACVVLCAFLAICASAATTNEFGTVETSSTIDLTGMATDTDLRVVLYDGTEYHTYPAQYIVTSANDITLDFTKINAAFGKNYSTENDSVIRIEIPRHVKTMARTTIWLRYSSLPVQLSQHSNGVALSRTKDSKKSIFRQALQLLTDRTILQNAHL